MPHDSDQQQIIEGSSEQLSLHKYRLGFDIGGTFTDLVLFDGHSGEIVIGKTLTTPEDPSAGAIRGIGRILAERGLGLSDLELAIHGTTLVSNAIIERRGAPTALLTTEGFRDILEIGTGRRYDMHDLFLEFPEPQIPRSARFEVPERTLFDGVVLIPLDLALVEVRVRECLQRGIQALAVCFLHSHANPEHELAVADLIRREYPELFLSISSELVGEVGEVERMSTTVANAYVQPIVATYLQTLSHVFRSVSGPESALADSGPSLVLMISSGGTTSIETAQSYPINLVESGPAAGALAAAFICEIVGIDSALSFDMGGTTAKACLIEGLKPGTSNELEVARAARFKKGSGIPLKVPVIDLIEVGAGGGSIAYLDELGLLKVGPRSAGAEPGPACYGRGGSDPTVTDASLVLGYLDPLFFLGGEMTLDTGKAEEVVRHQIAEPLKIDIVSAAAGIHEIVNESMADAARIHIAERNRDPRNLTVIAFGGAGPLHACAVAQKVQARGVVVPVAAGAASALGLLVAPPAIEYAHSYIQSLEEIDWGRVSAIFAELERRALATLIDMKVKPEDVHYQRSVDLRYVGQIQPTRVDIPRVTFGHESAATVADLFSRRYRELYGLTNPEYELEALSWRVRAVGPRRSVRLASREAGPSRQDSLKGQRMIYFRDVGFVTCDVFDHYLLTPGEVLHGPAVVEQRESTTVIPPGFRADVDQWRNLLIKLPSV